jgi:hypothetical protein
MRNFSCDYCGLVHVHALADCGCVTNIGYAARIDLDFMDYICINLCRVHSSIQKLIIIRFRCRSETRARSHVAFRCRSETRARSHVAFRCRSETRARSHVAFRCRSETRARKASPAPKLKCRNFALNNLPIFQFFNIE